MNGHKRYYSKKNVLDGERQILYDFMYMWGLKNKTETGS